MPEAHAALDTYLAGVDEDARPLVVALDQAVISAHAAFDVAVKYRMLMYAIGADWRHWVVSIDAHPKGVVALRFLYGVLLPDPRRVLRPGSSVLMTWDLPRHGPLDAGAVRAYVQEAVARYPEYRANAAAVAERAKRATASRATRPPDEPAGT